MSGVDLLTVAGWLGHQDALRPTVVFDGDAGQEPVIAAPQALNRMLAVVERLVVRVPP